MLIEIAVGDSYGAGFEFATGQRLKEITNDLSTYYRHNLPGCQHQPGDYTDDTQMSLAITELLLAGGNKNLGVWTVENIANKFVEVYKRDPRHGYSTKMQEILDSITDGDDFRSKTIANSTKCGAAMRSIPLGFLSAPKDILAAAQTQASITHNTTEGIRSSQAVALASFWLVNGFPKEKTCSFINECLKSKDVVWDDWQPLAYVSTSGYDVARAAISAVVRNDSLSKILKESVDYTGDVDSVGAIACGLGSLCKMVQKDLPANLLEGLENGRYGRDYLADLDQQLTLLGPSGWSRIPDSLRK